MLNDRGICDKKLKAENESCRVSFVHVQWMKGFSLKLLTSLDSDLMCCRLTFTSATNNNACTMNTVLRQKSNLK